MTDTPTPPATEKDALKPISDDRLVATDTSLAAMAAIESAIYRHTGEHIELRTVTLRALLHLYQQRRAIPTGEAVAAAREIIEASNKGPSFFVDWLAPRAAKVARALLASSGRDDGGKE